MELNTIYTPGRKLILILFSNECYIGDLKLQSETIIQLVNVYDVENKVYLKGPQSYYYSDILSINECEKNNVNLSSSSSLSSSDSVNHKEIKNHNSNTNNDSNLPEITLNELKEIENLAKNATYIFQTDHLYHDAINNLSRQESIVVSVESCKMGRYTNSDIITIATSDKIYIFDIKFLGKIHPELRNVLEADKPIKILHDSRKIADNLKFMHNVKITSMFDTLVAHIKIGGEKKIIDFNGCVQKYLKTPKSFFHDDKDTNWHDRPLDDERKYIAAKKALFLRKLYTVLLHKYLLKCFYKICDDFANSYRANSDDFAVVRDMVSKNQDSIEAIDDCDLDLSKSIDCLNLID